MKTTYSQKLQIRMETIYLSLSVKQLNTPLGEVNHKINLMDNKKVYGYHYPKCPDSLKVQLLDKLAKYKAAGWWEDKCVTQAAPMLCITKKDGKTLRTVIDCRKRNDNTVKDMTPFPDQDQIRLDVA